MTDTIYQFTARNVYKTIFNLKDLIDKKNNKLDQFNDTYSRGWEDENNKHDETHNCTSQTNVYKNKMAVQIKYT